MNSTLKLTHICRTFGKNNTKVEVLKDINLQIKTGEIVALVGPSGSGKSTLLHIAGLLDTPTSGMIEIMGQNATKMNDKGRTQLRMKSIGFVYQSHLLLPDFNALENVMMPQLIAGVRENQAKEHAKELLKQVGLSHRLTHRAGQLSGGEQQRVAIARALANNPALLLADEPTGNLDPKTADEVFDTFMKIVRQTGLSALLATHNPELAQKMDRRISVVDGKIQELT
ncbi:MAG: ABC transporter ATP-binding protein [Alphaproteobacteria bacterium]|nr:ABC transporter ATP-binding protein [Alphaproteobacteria bacterium]